MTSKRLNRLLLPLVILLAAAAVWFFPLRARAEGEGVTITGQPYYGTDYVQFTITGSGTWFYDAYKGNTLLYQHVKCDWGTTGSNNIGWEVDSPEEAAASRIVVYQGRTAGNNAVTAGVTPVNATYGDVTVTIGLYPAMQGDGNDFAANSAAVYNGVQYDLVSGNARDGFTYKKHEEGTVTATLTYLDTNGNVLKTEQANLTADGDTATHTFTLPDTLTADDGTTYNKVTSVNSYTANYNGTQLSFYATYRKAGESAPDASYMATIKMVCGDKTLMTDTVTVNKTYTYTAPTRFAATENGFTTVYDLASANNTLTLQPGDTQTKYTFEYTAQSSDANATWTLRFVNGDTGAVIGEETKTVAPGETATYDAPATRNVDGADYVLAGAAAYTYKYGDANAVQYIYYVPAGYTPETTYDITVRCVNIANNATIASSVVPANINTDTQLTSQSTLTGQDGKTYIRLGGQYDTWYHNYYSHRTEYVVYYRDVNDTLYVDTTVTEIRTITTTRTETTVVRRGDTTTTNGGTTDNGTTDGGVTEEVVTVYDGEAYQAGPSASQTLTSVSNTTTGQSELRTENGRDTATAREEIEANETPLAGPEANASDSVMAEAPAAAATDSGLSLPMLLSLLGAGALILLLLVLIYRQRRENRRADR